MESHDVFAESDVCYGETARFIGRDFSLVSTILIWTRWAQSPGISNASASVMIYVTCTCKAKLHATAEGGSTTIGSLHINDGVPIPLSI